MSFTSQFTTQERMSTAKDTVLVVEDDPGNAATLDFLLQFEGRHQSLWFRSAEEVLAHLDLVKDYRPVLFILDFFLPKMTGLDLYRRLHTTEGLESVPAMIVTGNRLTNEQKTTLTRFRLVLVSKPYDIDDILDTIRRLTA